VEEVVVVVVVVVVVRDSELFLPEGPGRWIT
jgi:hypothetical protein